jgi:hypothetical protein
MPRSGGKPMRCSKTEACFIKISLSAEALWMNALEVNQEIIGIP